MMDSLLAVADPGITINWISFIQTGGVIGMFVILTWALLRRKIVMGWTYDAMEQERDYYRELAHRRTELADRQMDMAEALFQRVGVLTARGAVLEAREQRRRTVRATPDALEDRDE